MSRSFSYFPSNVCSREYVFEIENDTILSLKIVGGCPGNTFGISRLVVGKKIDEIIDLLSGIKCPGSKTKDTSCPDQISKALSSYKYSSA